MLLVNLSRDSEYHTQRNNQLIPLTSCNTTSAIMALKASRIPFPCPDGAQPEDHLSELLLSEEAFDKKRRDCPWAQGIPPNQVHVMLEWAINKIVRKDVDQFKTDGTLQEIIWRLFQGTALVVHGTFHKCDHMVCAVGFVSTQHESDLGSLTDINLGCVQNMIIDDPFGDYRTGYKDHRGNDINISLDEFNGITHKHDRADAKWIHVFKRGEKS